MICQNCRDNGRRWEVKVEEEIGWRNNPCPIFFSSTSFSHVRVQNRSRTPRRSLVSSGVCSSQKSLCSQHVFPAQVPVRAAEQAASPVEEAGVISQEQEEHRGGKHRHTGDQLKPGQVSWCSLYALCLTDFGLHSQPFSISRVFLDADYPWSVILLEGWAIVVPFWAEVDPVFAPAIIAVSTHLLHF